jgi:hypothetical protein
MAYAHLFSSSQTGKVNWHSSNHVWDGQVLHFAIFFIGKIHFRFVFSRGACEAIKTAPLLVVDKAVEAMNKAAGFGYGIAT